MFEYSTQDSQPRDGLFLERLDTFMDKCLADIRAFAERELRSYEETRRYVAEWHAKYLFQPGPASSSASTSADRCMRVRSVLCDTSRILESLFDTCGVQSFLLAVDPHDLADTGFLGGSVVGREFWRGLRGGGEPGAKSFRSFCMKQQHSRAVVDEYLREPDSLQPTSPSTVKQSPAQMLKIKLYDAVRNALRSVSGIRNAEMKWTNPERLDIYGVRLVGWPSEIPANNPSTLKASQNKQLLEGLQNGTMKFEKVILTGREEQTKQDTNQGGNDVTIEDEDDFSWAYDADGGDPPPVTPTPLSAPNLGNSTWTTSVPDTSHSADSSPWNSSVGFDSSSSLGVNWEDSRSRKRARSHEPDAWNTSFS
ncbi:hypothetical protein BDQ12DRAFT_721829 [Crucibulum laeve]|uniref:Uncharacterized protein n=1 Tax=Crucibulum laeve TaxID=68775 RepID=A0A5C3M4Q6_9AGAR|nr:hypothetical protein BDQ12DRAFT_721829 [Crucibulum laeve]